MDLWYGLIFVNIVAMAVRGERQREAINLDLEKKKYKIQKERKNLTPVSKVQTMLSHIKPTEFKK